MSRGRSTAAQTKDRSMSEGLSPTVDARDPNKEVKRERIPMGKGQNLVFPNHRFDHDNYYYYCFTEQPHRPGKLAAAKAAWYEHALDEEGNTCSVPSGAGTTYLMRLPWELRNEDLAAKREKVARTLQDQTQLKDNEYAPTKNNREGGSSSMVEKTTSDNPYAS